MTRQLLALLALLTGLAAAGAPAHAQDASPEALSCEISAALEAVQSGGETHALIADAPSVTQQRLSKTIQLPLQSVLAVTVPTVMMRIDRAYE